MLIIIKNKVICVAFVKLNVILQQLIISSVNWRVLQGSKTNGCYTYLYL